MHIEEQRAWFEIQAGSGVRCSWTARLTGRWPTATGYTHVCLSVTLSIHASASREWNCAPEKDWRWGGRGVGGRVWCVCIIFFPILALTLGWKTVLLKWTGAGRRVRVWACVYVCVCVFPILALTLGWKRSSSFPFLSYKKKCGLLLAAFFYLSLSCHSCRGALGADLEVSLLTQKSGRRKPAYSHLLGHLESRFQMFHVCWELEERNGPWYANT